MGESVTRYDWNAAPHSPPLQGLHAEIACIIPATQRSLSKLACTSWQDRTWLHTTLCPIWIWGKWLISLRLCLVNSNIGKQEKEVKAFYPAPSASRDLLRPLLLQYLVLLLSHLLSSITHIIPVWNLPISFSQARCCWVCLLICSLWSGLCIALAVLELMCRPVEREILSEKIRWRSNRHQ